MKFPSSSYFLFPYMDPASLLSTLLWSSNQLPLLRKTLWFVTWTFLFYIYLIYVCMHTWNIMCAGWRTASGFQVSTMWDLMTDWDHQAWQQVLSPAETPCWECTIWWAWTGLWDHLATVKARHWNTLTAPSGSLHIHFFSYC